MSRRKDAELQQTKTNALQFRQELGGGASQDKIDSKASSKVSDEHTKKLRAIHLISGRLKEKGKNSTEVRRLLAGLEALEYDVNCKYAKHCALLRIARGMKYDSSTRISESEKRIIKSNLKEMKRQDRLVKSKRRRMERKKEKVGREVIRARDYLYKMENEVSKAVSYLSRDISGYGSCSDYKIDEAIGKLSSDVLRRFYDRLV